MLREMKGRAGNRTPKNAALGVPVVRLGNHENRWRVRIDKILFRDTSQLRRFMN